MSVDFCVVFGDFETVSERAMKAIDTAALTYLKLTKKLTFEELALFLRDLDIDASTICENKFIHGGAWRCEDCVKTQDAIFCQSCWTKTRDKHKDHNTIYITDVTGTCDCGDHNIIDKEYFCPDHIGIFNSSEEIREYIIESLGEELTSGLRIFHKTFFDKMAEYIIRAINDKKTKTQSFIKVMGQFVDCFGTLCKLNTACCYIIAELLLTNYPFKTKHTCINITNKGMKLNKSSVFAHECTCPFIRLLLEFWPVKKESILHKLIGYYQLKKVVGLFYLLLYGNVINEENDEIQKLSSYIIFDDVLDMAIQVPGLIDNVYESMIEIFEIFLKNKNNKSSLCESLEGLTNNEKFEDFKYIILKLKNDTIYLIKNSTLQCISNNLNIYKKVIKLAARFHNANSVKAIIPRPNKDKEPKFIIELLDAEIWLLDIIALFFTILNYDNANLIKDIFSYFSEKILDREFDIGDNEYSFHITLFRAFSIFLNRYCFHEANKNNTNILVTFQNVVKLMPDFKKCCKIMITSIYKVFGFVTACEEGFLNYYGSDMRKYEYAYYYFKEFIYRDFCLFKYLISLNENAKYVDFQYLLSLSQFEKSHELIGKYILNKGKIVSPDQWLTDWNKQYLKFSSKILLLILSILRNNTCLAWNLGSAYSMLKTNKIKDKLMDDLLTKDKNNFSELIKELIVNEILIKENLTIFTEIYDSIFPCLTNFFGEKYIKDLILSLTNKTLTKDKTAKFSIKDEYLYYLDLNYIIYPIHKTKCEKYISEFKSKFVSIFNIHFYPVNKFESKLAEANYNQIYFNDKNFDFLFQFTEFILTQKGYEILNEYFLSTLLNYLSAFLVVDNDQFIFLRENLPTNKIVQALEKNNLKDEVKKSYCQFLVNKMKSQGQEKSNINKKEDENNVKPIKKNTKESMKEKMKNKFKKKNENMNDKLGIDKIIIEEKRNDEPCIYCLKPINTSDINIPYGVIGDFLCDNFISNAFFQGIREKYKKYYDEDENLPAFDVLYYQTSDRSTIRIISCNHYIHFKCFFNTFMDSDLSLSLDIFSCPLCNRKNETCIPILTQYTSEQTFGYFKGFNFNDIFQYGKNHIEEYKEKNKDKFPIFEKMKETNSEEIKKANDNFRKTYPDFVNLCKHFVEGFIGTRAGLDSVDLENEALRPIIASKYSLAIAIQYRDLFSYLNIVEDKNNSIMLWKNFILSIRLMLKLDIIIKENYILQLYKLLNEFRTYKFDTSVQKIVQSEYMKLMTCEILSLLTLFFDYEQIEGYEKYILYMVLPLYAFGFYFRELYFKKSFGFEPEYFLEHLNSEEMYKFLNEETSFDLILIQVVEQLSYTKIIMNKNIDVNKLSLKLEDNLDLLNLSNLKGKTLLQTLDELEKLIEIDSTNEKMRLIYENFKPQYNYKEMFKIILDEHIETTKKNKCDKVLSPALFGSCLPKKFTFVDLPELAIDLEFLIYSIGCIYCKAIGRRALICLDCGRVVCDSRACLTEYKGEKIAGFFAHTIICGGGRSAFLQSDNGSVLFITRKAVFRKFLPLYVNEFGEGINKKQFGKEFKLNKEEVKNALKMFTEYSYTNAEIIV